MSINRRFRAPENDDGSQSWDNIALLEAARQGDQDAWMEIVHRYERVIRAATATFRLGSSDTIDVVQSTWLRLLEHAATIREPNKLGGWLATTARRECLTLIRRGRREVPLEGQGFEPQSAEPTPEEAAIAAEMQVRVRAATSALSGRPGALIDALFYQPCYNYAQVAHDIGMPIGSIGPTRIRTLQTLRQTLSCLNA